MMKSIIIKLLLIVIVFWACLYFIFFPDHPNSWYHLKRWMFRSEVNELLEFKNLELVKEYDEDSNAEKWRKRYIAGEWVIFCEYNSNQQFMNAYVYYNSYVFPFIKRMRNYPQP